MTSASILTESGHHRDNRRGQITVEATAADMAELIITMPPSFGQTASTIRVVVAGEHLSELWKAMRKADTTARRLRTVTPAIVAGEGAA